MLLDYSKKDTADHFIEVHDRLGSFALQRSIRIDAGVMIATSRGRSRPNRGTAVAELTSARSTFKYNCIKRLSDTIQEAAKSSKKELPKNWTGKTEQASKTFGKRHACGAPTII